MIWLNILWFVFAAIFLALGCFHWKMVGKSISYLQVTEDKNWMPIKGGIRVQIAGTDIVEFADKFNRYIDYYNQTSKKQHKMQAIGYWVASIIAVFSFVLVIVS